MSDLTDMQARLASLKECRDTGVLTMKHGDTLSTFRSLDEIERIIAVLEAEIAALSANGVRVRALRFTTRSGW